MVRTFVIIMSVLVIATCTYFGGLADGQQATADVGGYVEPAPPEVEVVKTLKVEAHEVVRERVIYDLPLQEFQSRAALGEWLAASYISRQDGWVCVDYALEMQRRALKDGYLVSVQLTDTDLDRVIDHAICATWIGNKCYFFEPQNTTCWVGAIKGD